MECTLFLAWAIAVGEKPTVGYDLLLDGVVVEQTTDNTGTVCIEPGDTTTHVITVRAFAADGARGPVSDPLIGTREQMILGGISPATPTPSAIPQRTPTATATPTSTGGPTPTASATPIPTPTPTVAPAVHADIDGDGQVGFEDYSIILLNFGACHDGRKEVPCD